MYSIANLVKKNDIFLDDFEGKIFLTLSNPLTLLGVKNYNEEPNITKCIVKIYAYTELDDKDFINFCNTALKNSFIYNTLKNAIPITINFIPTL